MIITKELGLSNYSLRFVLSAYKYGYIRSNYLRRSDVAKKTCENLEKFGYITLYEPNMTTKKMEYAKRAGYDILIMGITEKGIEFIESNFIDILKHVPLYYMFPIVLPGDIIHLNKEFKQKAGSVFPAGSYVVNISDRESLTVTYNLHFHRVGVMNEGPRKIPTYEIKDISALSLQEPIDGTTERIRRCGLINVKSLSRMLCGVTSNLETTELIGNLYDLSMSKYRIEGAPQKVGDVHWEKCS